MEEKGPDLYLAALGVNQSQIRALIGFSVFAWAHRDIVVYHNIFPAVVLVDFDVVNTICVVVLALKHLLEEELVVLYRVEAIRDDFTFRIFSRRTGHSRVRIS